MALTFLSGTDEFIGKKKGFHPFGTKESRHATKERAKKALKKVRVAKIALAPARTAFLEAVRLNVLHLGTKLAKMYKSQPGEVDNFWDKFGGDHAKLRSAVEKGSKQKLSGAIGEPVTLAAGMATALPIVLKVVDLFKKFGLHNEEDQKQTEEFTEKAQSKLESDPQTVKTSATMPEGEKTGKITEDSDLDKDGNPVKVPFYKNKKVLIGTGLGLLLIGGAVAFAKHKKKAA